MHSKHGRGGRRHRRAKQRALHAERMAGEARIREACKGAKTVNEAMKRVYPKGLIRQYDNCVKSTPLPPGAK